MRINKTTTVGAVAACAVIGATSPVWADSGSGTSSNDQTAGAAEQAAVLNALQAEIAKLKDEVKADENALQAATQAAKAEADALAKARAAAAHWKAVAQRKSVRTVTVPAAASTFNRDAGESNDSTDATDGHKWCHHHNGYGARGDYGDRHYRNSSYGDRGGYRDDNEQGGNDNWDD